MSMRIRGVELDDQQLNSIVPIINKYSQKRLTKKEKARMETDCIEAMNAAGCPLIEKEPSHPYANFWSLPSVVNLGLCQKAVLLYLLTSRFSDSDRGFELPVHLAAAELGITKEVLREALVQFQMLNLVEFDEENSEVVIKLLLSPH